MLVTIQIWYELFYYEELRARKEQTSSTLRQIMSFMLIKMLNCSFKCNSISSLAKFFFKIFMLWLIQTLSIRNWFSHQVKGVLYLKIQDLLTISLIERILWGLYFTIEIVLIWRRDNFITRIIMCQHYFIIVNIRSCISATLYMLPASPNFIVKIVFNYRLDLHTFQSLAFLWFFNIQQIWMMMMIFCAYTRSRSRFHPLLKL